MGDCPKWEEFLKQVVIDQKSIDQLQEFFGYCLHDSNEFHKALAIVGTVASGKSIIWGVLRAVVGDELVSYPGLNDLSCPYSRAELSDKRVAFFDDIPSPSNWAAFFKSFVSGDPIEAHFRYKPSFKFIPICKFVLALNYYPSAALDFFLGGRLLLIQTMEFPLVIRQNPSLFDWLIAELNGISAWSKVGLDRLIERGGFDE